ncbi:MAG: DUF11 domain-containing protein [Eubacteriaceae bacterium]|jgi:uncharacterized repeat protein (TIGR01451 family)|nr:DUF11 domain-containing protein [Eubacteriaceae bacterium]
MFKKKRGNVLTKILVMLLCAVTVMTYSLYGINACAQDTQSVPETAKVTAEESSGSDTSASGSRESAANAAENKVGGEESLAEYAQPVSDYDFGISGTEDASAAAGSVYSFKKGIKWTPSDPAEWKEGDLFRLTIVNVDTPAGGSYKYKKGDQNFTPSDTDAGLIYTIHYEIQKKQSDGTWKSPAKQCTAEKNIKIKSSVKKIPAKIRKPYTVYAAKKMSVMNEDDVLSYAENRNVVTLDTPATDEGFKDVYDDFKSEGDVEHMFIVFNNISNPRYITGNTYVYHEDVTANDATGLEFSGRFIIWYNFGRTSWNAGTQKTYSISDQSDWPDNLKNKLTFSTDATNFECNYTYSADDMTWANTHTSSSGTDPYGYQLSIMPIFNIKKLPADNEARANLSITGNGWVSENGVPISTKTIKNFKVFCNTDKKTVEIASKIAPVADDGTVGTYTNDKVYLKPGQKGSVQVTLSRPVGIYTSGRCNVTSAVPDGMTYVPGSAAAVSSSGIQTTVDDSAGAPSVDFTRLPVGETVTVTYQVKAPDSVTSYTEYKTKDTLINKYQRDHKGFIYNTEYPETAVYPNESEYTSVRHNIFAVGATPPVKDVFVNDSEVSGDGQTVNAGDELTYKITYKNTTGNDVKAVITDALPANCTFISADNGGSESGGKVIWNDIAAANGASVTVSFKVRVDAGNGTTLENTARVYDGANNYSTNTTKNPTAAAPVKPSAGSITVTKNVTSQDNKAVNVSGTFYFTLFSDAACTQAAGKPQTVTVSNGVSASAVFSGLAQGTYYAAETNADGTKVVTVPEDTDNYTGYGVDGNAAKITISASSLTGSAVITNRYSARSGKTPTTPKTPTSPKTPIPLVPASDKSAQTGDSFKAGLWIILMLIGAAGCTACAVRRRKENSEE